MTHQLLLLQTQEDSNRKERFERFHRDNPHVYQLLCRYARDAKQKGFEHYSMRTIWELVRWHSQLHIKGDWTPGVDFKLNDHYPPFYARRIMQQEPDLAGFFELRERNQ